MLLRFFCFLSAIAAALVVTPAVQASQICENVVVGQTPPQIIGYQGPNNNQPVYGSPQPIYQQQCVWKYGAVAIDPATRGFSSAWNYDDIDSARNYVINQCGQHCAWVSFPEDFAFIALSDNDRTWGISVISSADAERQCQAAGGIDCATVIAASSTASARYWSFGAVAYDVTTGLSSAAWSHVRRSEALAAAVKSCGQPGCWGYAFQTGFGGIAMADDGALYGAWSARGEESAGRVAVKSCEKEKGKKACSIVTAGSALAAPKYKPKTVKPKKAK
jgi:hypothetical protein